MVKIKISQARFFNIVLNGKQVTMSLSNEGVKFSRKFKNRKHTVRFTWEALDEDFNKMEQDTP